MGEVIDAELELVSLPREGARRHMIPALFMRTSSTGALDEDAIGECLDLVQVGQIQKA